MTNATRRIGIKTDAIAHLDELLIDLTSKLEERGCKVFFAEDAAQARDYIVALAQAKGAKNVVKGKSMTTEEIDLNDALAKAGIDAVETDLGEYIVQLRGERPSAHHHARNSSVEGRHRAAFHRQVRHRVHCRA